MNIIELSDPIFKWMIVRDHKEYPGKEHLWLCINEQDVYDTMNRIAEGEEDGNRKDAQVS